MTSIHKTTTTTTTTMLMMLMMMMMLMLMLMLMMMCVVTVHGGAACDHLTFLWNDKSERSWESGPEGRGRGLETHSYLAWNLADESTGLDTSPLDAIGNGGPVKRERVRKLYWQRSQNDRCK